jgi:hypothetical protein
MNMNNLNLASIFRPELLKFNVSDFMTIIWNNNTQDLTLSKCYHIFTYSYSLVTKAQYVKDNLEPAQ